MIKLTDIQQLSKQDVKILIDQLEGGMSDILKNGEIDKANKLNILIGNVIDIYLSK